MPFNIRSFDQLLALANAELRRRNPDIDPSIYGSFSLPYNASAAALAFSVQQTVADLAVQLFPQTANGEFLEQWANYENLSRLPSVSAVGTVAVPGTNGAQVPVNTRFTSPTAAYDSLSVATVSQYSRPITAIARSGRTVTATIGAGHRLASGLRVTIANVRPSSYNNDYDIVAADDTRITFDLPSLISEQPTVGAVRLEATRFSGGTSSAKARATVKLPAEADLLPGILNVAVVDGANTYSAQVTVVSADTLTTVRRKIVNAIKAVANTVVTARGSGRIVTVEAKAAGAGADNYTVAATLTPTPATAACAYANVEIRATEAGVVGNALPGTRLSVSSVPNIGRTAYVGVDGLSGGAEVETDDFLRARVLLSRSIVEGVFTEDQVKLAALGVPGNTRAFVVPPETTILTSGAANKPVPGQVFVYILRDGQQNILPSDADLDRTKEAIIRDGKMPSHTAEQDVFVKRPSPVRVNVTVTNIDPDSPTMRAAVVENIKAFFEDNVGFQENIHRNALLAAIYVTIDLETGTNLKSFNLTEPAAGVDVSAGQIAVVGAVSVT